jgi:peroxiredoxin
MMTRASWLILALAVLAAAAGGWLQHAAQQRRLAVDLVGQKLPDLVLADLGGHPHHLSSYTGRRVLLNAWASWCDPCREEMPALVRAQARFGVHGAVVIGIGMDEPARARRFLAAHPVNYPILQGQLASPGTLRQLGDKAEVLPYSVLLDADGRVLATHVGRLDDARLEAWLAPDAAP